MDARRIKGERGEVRAGIKPAPFSRRWIEKPIYGVDNNDLPGHVSIKEMANPVGTMVKDNCQKFVWSGVSRKSSSADAAGDSAS